MNEMSNDFTVDPEKLASVLDELAGLAKPIAEKTGDLRNRIKEVLETQGYEKGALATIRKIEAMSETKRADFLRTFEPMFQAMLDLKWRAETSDMLEGIGEETNVQPFDPEAA